MTRRPTANPKKKDQCDTNKPSAANHCTYHVCIEPQNITGITFEKCEPFPGFLVDLIVIHQADRSTKLLTLPEIGQKMQCFPPFTYVPKPKPGQLRFRWNDRKFNPEKPLKDGRLYDLFALGREHATLFPQLEFLFPKNDTTVNITAIDFNQCCDFFDKEKFKKFQAIYKQFRKNSEPLKPVTQETPMDNNDYRNDNKENYLMAQNLGFFAKTPELQYSDPNLGQPEDQQKSPINFAGMFNVNNDYSEEFCEDNDPDSRQPLNPFGSTFHPNDPNDKENYPMTQNLDSFCTTPEFQHSDPDLGKLELVFADEDMLFCKNVPQNQTDTILINTTVEEPFSFENGSSI